MLFVLVNTKSDIIDCELQKNNSDKCEMFVRNMSIQKKANKFLIISNVDPFLKDKWKERNKTC